MSSNLYGLIRERVQPHLDRPALTDAVGAGPSFRELDELAARFAAVLRRRGVAAGDRVVAQTEKSIGTVALYLACLRIGALYVPLNTAYTDAEVDYFLGDAEPRLFVGLRERPARADQVVTLGVATGRGLWGEALATPPDYSITECGKDQVAAIVYTSGTTGRSKGAMLTHGNLASNGLALHRIWGFRDGDVLLHALPVFHVHGLFVALHCALLNASTTIFLPKFDAAEVRRLLPAATVLMGVPTFYTRLLALPGFGAADCRHVRLFISGSAPLLAETHREFAARTGARILERYGMTETGMITSNPLDGERIAGTVGHALPGVDVRVADDAGRPLPPGVTGTVEVRGPNVFAGYWRMPQKTAQEFRPDGYFVTGDLGSLAEDGRLTLVGRAKDLIISGGYNIYPKEIEDALDGLPGVSESAVIGVPHADLGEGVIAVVVPAPGARLVPGQLLAQLEPLVARFKRPRRIFIVDELPRNAMGKVQKAVLRAAHAAALNGEPA